MGKKATRQIAAAADKQLANFTQPKLQKNDDLKQHLIHFCNFTGSTSLLLIKAGA